MLQLLNVCDGVSVQTVEHVEHFSLESEIKNVISDFKDFSEVKFF